MGIRCDLKNMYLLTISECGNGRSIAKIKNKNKKNEIMFSCLKKKKDFMDTVISESTSSVI